MLICTVCTETTQRYNNSPSIHDHQNGDADIAIKRWSKRDLFPFFLLLGWPFGTHFKKGPWTWQNYMHTDRLSILWLPSASSKSLTSLWYHHDHWWQNMSGNQKVWEPYTPLHILHEKMVCYSNTLFYTP